MKKTPSRSAGATPGRAGRLDREIDEYLAQGGSRGGGRRSSGGPVTIDHGRIPREDLRIALANAERNPDGETFPWLPQYPTAGGTVYYGGRLWTVVGKDRHRDDRSMATRVHLEGQGHDDSTVQARGDLRPVSWTQRDEDRYQRETN